MLVASLLELPMELVDEIAAYLFPSELLPLTRVCKPMNALFTPALYRNVKLNIGPFTEKPFPEKLTLFTTYVLVHWARSIVNLTIWFDIWLNTAGTVNKTMTSSRFRSFHGLLVHVSGPYSRLVNLRILFDLYSNMRDLTVTTDAGLEELAEPMMKSFNTLRFPCLRSFVFRAYPVETDPVEVPFFRKADIGQFIAAHPGIDSLEIPFSSENIISPDCLPHLQSFVGCAKLAPVICAGQRPVQSLAVNDMLHPTLHLPFTDGIRRLTRLYVGFQSQQFKPAPPISIEDIHGIEDIHSIVASCPNLEVLHISVAIEIDVAVFEAIAALHNLHCLSLDMSRHSVDPDRAEDILQAIKQSSLPSLPHLRCVRIHKTRPYVKFHVDADGGVARLDPGSFLTTKRCCHWGTEFEKFVY